MQQGPTVTGEIRKGEEEAAGGRGAATTPIVSGLQNISSQLRQYMQSGQLAVEKFSLSSERIQNGISVDFQMRLKVKFQNGGETRKAPTEGIPRV